MADNPSTDCRYRDGSYEPVGDFLADCPTGADVDAYMESIGWSRLFTVGCAAGPLAVDCWQHPASGEFLAQVQTTVEFGPYVLVSTFGDLMDLVARWAPALQVALLAELSNELHSSRVDPNGLVERIARRAAG